MTYGVNTYETANASGTTITAGNSTDGGAGFTPTTANSGTVKFDNTHTHRGSMAAAFDATAGITAVARADITSISGAASILYEFYFWIDAAPATATARIVDIQCTSGTSLRVGLTTGRLLLVQNSAGTTLFTASNACATGAWHRVAFYSKPGTGTTDGTAKLWTYLSANADTTTTTETYSATNINAGTGTITAVRKGKSDSSATLKMWIDDDQFDTVASTPLGPPPTAYALVPAGSATSTGTISALGLGAPLSPAGSGASTGAVSSLALGAPLTVAGSGTSTGSTSALKLTAPLAVVGGGASTGTVTALSLGAPLVVAGAATSTADGALGQAFALTVTGSATSLATVGPLLGPIRDITLTGITEPSRYAAVVASTRYAATVEENS